jgi:hypothetical protein
MSMQITIQDSETVDVGVTDTSEAVSVQVWDGELVAITITEAGNSTALMVDESGELVEINLEVTTENVRVQVAEATEIVVTVDEAYRIVSDPILDDLNKTVDGSGGPVGGTNTWLLPVEWKGKRFRVFRAGSKFINWQVVTGTPQDSLELTASGDVWMGTDENGAGFEERISLENY